MGFTFTWNVSPKHYMHNIDFKIKQLVKCVGGTKGKLACQPYNFCGCMKYQKE